MLPSTFYHVYNRANGNENLFPQEKNYSFFLEKFTHHINPVADTYAYCLMPNHFHFLLRIKEEEELRKHFSAAGKTSKVFENLGGLVSQHFSNLFNSYTKAFNKTYDRKGSLFSPNFKQKEITSEAYLTNVIHYIHANPVHHGFVKDLYDWPHSSVHAYLTQKKTALKREEVIQWFGGSQEFSLYHQRPIEQIMMLEMEF
jgi:putative transposase